MTLRLVPKSKCTTWMALLAAKKAGHTLAMRYAFWGLPDESLALEADVVLSVVDIDGDFWKLRKACFSGLADRYQAIERAT